MTVLLASTLALLAAAGDAGARPTTTGVAPPRAAPASSPSPAASPAPGAALPVADDFLRLHGETRGFRAGRPVSVKVLPGGEVALFLRSGPRSGVQGLYLLQLSTGEAQELLGPEVVAAAVGAGEVGDAARARLERQRITARGITHLQPSEDGATILVSAGGRLLAVERAGGKVRALPVPPDALDPRLAPDGRQLAFVSGGELQVLDLATGQARALTTGAGPWLTHGLAEFVAQEEMDRPEGYWWSPDSRWLLFQEADDTRVEKLSIPDPARPEREPVRFAYPRAGRENTRVRLGVVAAGGGPVTWVDWDRERYPYLARVRWEKGGAPLVLVQNRAQTEEALLALDPATGRATTLLVEKDPAWLNLHRGLPRWMPDGSGFLWFTERNGGAELELRRPDGAWAASLVPPGSFVDLAGVDPSTGAVYVTAIRGDPTHDRLLRVRPGAVAEEIPVPSEGPAALSAALSRDGASLVVTVTGAGGSRSLVLAPDGRVRAVVPSVAVEPPFRPDVEVRRAGASGLWASVVKPRDFRRGRKYPVLVQVYGGPLHLAPVLRSGKLLAQWRADQGYIVVEVLNRGSTMRLGRDFERAVKGDFAGPTLDDQVEGLRALAAAIPEMDLARVGVEGWSFGGYMAALAVLKRPDVFRAASAGAPVVDWRDYDTHYTERYLGLPSEAPAAYERSSLLTWVKDPRRPLLLLHGTADDNVYFLNSLKLADALFRAGAPATFVPLQNVTHLPADPSTREALLRAQVRFFTRELGTQEPVRRGGAGDGAIRGAGEERGSAR